MPVTRALNPALAAFVAHIGDGLVVAEVMLHPVQSGYELRHVADRAADPSALRTVALEELRAVAQLTSEDGYRPLRSAPTLRNGWRAIAANAEEMGAALDNLYPGAVADWFAARGALPPVTSYREFAARQTGMYRVMTLLDDTGVARVIEDCCAARACLKRRFWSVPGVGADCVSEKSIIPCLEPCAVLMDAARKAVRREQPNA